MQRGDSLAISAELVDAQNDDQIWGQQYNRKASDIHAPGRDREGNHHNAAAALNNRRREAHAGGQVIEQHQCHDGEITKGAEALPETGDLVSGKRNHRATGLPQSQCGSDTAMRPAVAERRSRRLILTGLYLPSRRPELIRAAQTVLVRS